LENALEELFTLNVDAAVDAPTMCERKGVLHADMARQQLLEATDGRLKICIEND